MKFGAALPTTPELDANSIGARARALEEGGFDFLTVGGHLLTAPSGRYKGRPDYQYARPYHDPFVLFGFLAACTSRIHLVSSVVILPLRETAAVARQSAELALLSGGRVELGVGLSWQEAEYKAVGQDLHQRGARLSEQVALLRLYWTQPYVTFKGRFHDVDELGLGKLPPAPIPIWFGTTFNESSMRRAASLGDGWMPISDPTAALPTFKEYVGQAGRSAAEFPLMARLAAGDGGTDAWVAEGQRLRSLGITHIIIDPPAAMAVDAAMERVVSARTALSRAIR